MLRHSLIFASLCMCGITANALYDSKPGEEVSDLQGTWAGTLTYNDYSQPGKLVTLQTKLFIALSSPTELTLHYVFNDGPGKTVYSYEKMDFLFERGEILWTSGTAEKLNSVYQILSQAKTDDAKVVVFQRLSKSGFERITFTFGKSNFGFRKNEVDRAGIETFRNEFKFARVGA